MYDSSDFKTCYFDEHTSEILPLELIQVSMMEELSYFSEKTVWAATEYSETKANTDATFVRMRWVLCNQGDEKDMSVLAWSLMRLPRTSRLNCTCQDLPLRRRSSSSAVMRVKDPEPANRST